MFRVHSVSCAFAPLIAIEAALAKLPLHPSAWHAL